MLHDFAGIARTLSYEMSKNLQLCVLSSQRCPLRDTHRHRAQLGPLLDVARDASDYALEGILSQ